MIAITSRANPHFKSLRLLAASGKERRGSGRMVLDGPHLVGAYLDRGGIPELLAVDAEAMRRPEIASLVARSGDAPVLGFAPELFAQLAPVDHPVGILAVAAIPRPQARAPGSCVVMLEGIQDPGNVGTIIRTAAAAGASDVLLSAGCAEAWSPRTLRAGMGAHFAIAVRTAADLVQELSGFDGKVITTVVRGGMPPHAVDLSGPVAFVFGGEGGGLGEAWSRTSAVPVTIPMASGIESLNVAAAAAVLLFERVRQLSGSEPPGFSTA